MRQLQQPHENLSSRLARAARLGCWGEIYTTFDSVDETPHMGGLNYSTRRDLDNGIGWDHSRSLCGEQVGHLFTQCNW